MPHITITWYGIQEWEMTRERVNKILEKHTGTSEYPQTKSLPPIMIGIQNCPQDGIEELKALPGVNIRGMDD
ncbi:hypothetical protein FSPOR_2989 [Fusarium sporotrichioides]|uniref:Uncharacterized protein n=1 Tax=Fusarium sporotrichioides TaxID=5514 RepID=A0A395SHC8_FUSSP|nr:hypothetical protein FSPOR_2989 [Fusarium sporotrichioides]